MKLCRIGMHSWTGWKIIKQGTLVESADSLPVGSYFVQEAVCKHCGFTKRKRKEIT